MVCDVIGRNYASFQNYAISTCLKINYFHRSINFVFYVVIFLYITTSASKLDMKLKYELTHISATSNFVTSNYLYVILLVSFFWKVSYKIRFRIVITVWLLFFGVFNQS